MQTGLFRPTIATAGSLGHNRDYLELLAIENNLHLSNLFKFYRSPVAGVWSLESGRRIDLLPSAIAVPFWITNAVD